MEGVVPTTTVKVHNYFVLHIVSGRAKADVLYVLTPTMGGKDTKHHCEKSKAKRYTDKYIAKHVHRFEFHQSYKIFSLAYTGPVHPYKQKKERPAVPFFVCCLVISVV